MKKSMKNAVHIEGYLYESDISLRESGEKSKNPGTPFYSGTVSVATDDAMTNIVQVRYSYVAEYNNSKNGEPPKKNGNFALLKQIADGDIRSVMKDGKENASKIRIDSAIGLNDFYSDRTGNVELVSVKGNEGGFIHIANDLNPDEKERATFDVDMVITGTRRIEADPERGYSNERMIVKGAIFNYAKALLPVEFTVIHPQAMTYFENLEPSGSNPVFTNVRGRMISETVMREKTEEGAWGEPIVRMVSSSRKDWVIIWAQREPYLWDDESTLTAKELSEAVANREVYLATVKQRFLQNASAPASTAPAKGAFNF